MPLRARRRIHLLRAYRVAAQVLLSYLSVEVRGFFLGAAWKERALTRTHPKNARRIAAALTALEGLFIKVGQLVSILTNFLPEEFRGELESLQDRIPPRPRAEIAERVQAELGDAPERLFASFDDEPLASASLAQVHAATLDDGRRVAVKVQHRGIEDIVQLDLVAIRRILALLRFVLRFRGLETLHGELRKMIEEELDFSLEADHLEAIGANLAEEPGLAVPAVVRERSSRRVLTTELVDGFKITDREQLAEHGIDPETLAERVLTAYGRMIFVDGLYHADPHPGNLLVRPDGTLVLLDFGAVARLSPRMKDGLVRFFEAVLHRDADKIVAALRTMGFVARRDPERVAERVIEYFQDRFLDQVTLDSWSLEDIHVDARMKLEAMADLRRMEISLRQLTSSFEIPSQWLLLERTVLLLMGLCTHLAPTLNPMTTLRPFLEEHVLGPDRDWMGLVGSVVKNMALRAVTLPEDLQRTLKRVNRGELEVRVPEIHRTGRLLYALGHQLIYTLLLIAGLGFGYLLHREGETQLAEWALGGAGFFGVCLVVSVVRARRWSRQGPGEVAAP